MDLVKALQNIRAKGKLDGNTALLVKLKSGGQVKGNYVSCIAAGDNDPEIAQLDVRDQNTGSTVGILETEIQSITAE
ncbi:hypothetical protein A7X67_08230 [Clostridium sp. W14A]|nr:hypothetical protein A7X67_08230 [Clostridium sp. W14A]